ncbi:MAG: hypothetical protein PHP26_01035 [Syntrophomonas sp.]|uniref:hypothetical protein n=1 Tax=Syntrophomonas sp. TaxID=2053627 RepID=UPI002608122F|nr:hypothetical protein [Syntrophomonas sp.]MDD2509889.1 hypothetical protein [Syntrophomonas sp.]MDD3878566.1 hypothetical protein [Syntrophomonas sp.]MDD4626193.1 hypothetical protein [Syntrophomonas sp.]
MTISKKSMPSFAARAALTISVDVTPGNMLELYGLDSLIIVLSMGISSVIIMRLKPREILSMMS